MKKTKKILALLMAISMLAGLSACSDNGGDVADGDVPADETTTTAPVITTTAKTVEINTEELKDEEQVLLEDAMTQLKDVELENKEVKWLSHYDLNPSAEVGGSTPAYLELFQQKYDGYLKYYPTTWDTRYNDLSTYVLGGEGIDLFPAGDNPLPKGVTSGMFQPIDDYIDLNDPIWAEAKPIIEQFNFSGKHYALATGAEAEVVVHYNTNTLENNNLEDPWDLYKEGKWTWDKMEEMLLDFVDPDAEQYGLDGWWAEKGLLASNGVPLIGTDADHNIVCNINSPKIEEVMNFQARLFSNGLVMDKAEYGYTENPSMMGEGKQLFYFYGSWAVLKDPNTWDTEILPEHLGMAPVPCKDEGGTYYHNTKLHGYVLCKDAGNPQGAALFAECAALSETNEGMGAIDRRKKMEDFQMSEELLLRLDEINGLATANPVVELSTGASVDIASITSEAGENNGIRATMHGGDWTTEKERIGEVLIALVAEVDAQVKESQNS